jgi:hypothetical protein
MLQRLFQPTQVALPTGPSLLVASPQQQVYVFDLLRRHQFDPTIEVLHLSGYSLGRYVHLQGGLGEEALLPETLAHHLSRLPGLRVVFLNGCATHELLLALLRKDIPAIVATQATHQRSEHIHLAYHFYQRLLKGASLRDTMQGVQRSHPQPLPTYPVSYQLQADRFDWPGQPQDLDSPLAPGLYLQDHHAKVLDWALLPAPTGQAAPAFPHGSPQQLTQANRRPFLSRLVGLF